MKFSQMQLSIATLVLCAILTILKAVPASAVIIRESIDSQDAQSDDANTAPENVHTHGTRQLILPSEQHNEPGQLRATEPIRNNGRQTITWPQIATDESVARGGHGEFDDPVVQRSGSYRAAEIPYLASQDVPSLNSLQRMTVRNIKDKGGILWTEWRPAYARAAGRTSVRPTDALDNRQKGLARSFSQGTERASGSLQDASLNFYPNSPTSGYKRPIPRGIEPGKGTFKWHESRSPSQPQTEHSQGIGNSPGDIHSSLGQTSHTNDPNRPFIPPPHDDPVLENLRRMYLAWLKKKDENVLLAQRGTPISTKEAPAHPPSASDPIVPERPGSRDDGRRRSPQRNESRTYRSKDSVSNSQRPTARGSLGGPSSSTSYKQPGEKQSGIQRNSIQSSLPNIAPREEPKNTPPPYIKSMITSKNRVVKDWSTWINAIVHMCDPDADWKMAQSEYTHIMHFLPNIAVHPLHKLLHSDKSVLHKYRQRAEKQELAWYKESKVPARVAHELVGDSRMVLTAEELDKLGNGDKGVIRTPTGSPSFLEPALRLSHPEQRDWFVLCMIFYYLERGVPLKVVHQFIDDIIVVRKDVVLSHALRPEKVEEFKGILSKDGTTNMPDGFFLAYVPATTTKEYRESMIGYQRKLFSSLLSALKIMINRRIQKQKEKAIDSLPMSTLPVSPNTMATDSGTRSGAPRGNSAGEQLTKELAKSDAAKETSERQPGQKLDASAAEENHDQRSQRQHADESTSKSSDNQQPEEPRAESEPVQASQQALEPGPGYQMPDRSLPHRPSPGDVRQKHVMHPSNESVDVAGDTSSEGASHTPSSEFASFPPSPGASHFLDGVAPEDYVRKQWQKSQAEARRKRRMREYMASWRKRRRLHRDLADIAMGLDAEQQEVERAYASGSKPETNAARLKLLLAQAQMQGEHARRVYAWAKDMLEEQNAGSPGGTPASQRARTAPKIGSERTKDRSRTVRIASPALDEEAAASPRGDLDPPSPLARLAASGARGNRPKMASIFDVYQKLRPAPIEIPRRQLPPFENMPAASPSRTASPIELAPLPPTALSEPIEISGASEHAEASEPEQSDASDRAHRKSPSSSPSTPPIRLASSFYLSGRHY